MKELPFWSEQFIAMGIEFVKGYLKKKIDEKKLYSNLQKYLLYELNRHKNAYLSEEYDMQGLLNYIHDNLFEDFNNALFLPRREQRESARKCIIDKALAYSNAMNDESKCQVKKVILGILTIYHDFFKKKNSPERLILTNDMIDALSDDLSSEANKVIDAGKMNTEMILNSLSYSPDKLGEMARQKDFVTLKNRLLNIQSSVDCEHPLYPYYGTRLEGEELFSHPLSEEAYRKYPPKIVCTGEITVGGKEVHGLPEDVENYAYRHQETIEYTVKDAQKRLGNINDPFQYEAEKLIGAVLVKHPAPFPPAFSCRVSIDDEVFYDNVLFRTQEILDDDTIVVSNIEEKRTYLLQVEIIPRKRMVRLSSSIKNAKNPEMLQYLKLMKKASQGGILSIFSYEDQIDIASGHLAPFTFSTGFTSINEEIDFLERICIIERFFDTEISIPEEIHMRDFERIQFLSDILSGEEKDESWKELVLEGTVDEGLRKMVDTAAENELVFWISSDATFPIFGREFSVVLDCFYRTVRLADLEKMQLLMKCLSDGDPVKVRCIPGDNNMRIEKLHKQCD